MCLPTYCCFECVSTNTIGAVERCCAFNRVAKEGCVMVLPCCGETITNMRSTRTQAIELQVGTKTLDNVFVEVFISIQYTVLRNEISDNGLQSEYQAMYALQNPVQLITAYVYDVVRATVPRMDLDHAFEDKDRIAQEVKKTLTVMKQFGFEVVKTLVTDLEPNHKVKDAMNEINAAARIKEAAKEKAQADKILVVKRAEAQCESKILSGHGVAKQRKAIIDGLRNSIVDWSDGKGDKEGNSAQDVMDLLLLTQYFDMLNIVGQNPSSTTAFVPFPLDGIDTTREALISAHMER